MLEALKPFRDPDPACKVVTVMVESKEKCLRTLSKFVDFYKHRMVELGKKTDEAVVLVVNLNSYPGKFLAHLVIPSHEIPDIKNEKGDAFAIGIAVRNSLMSPLGKLDSVSAQRLAAYKGVAFVIIDRNAIEVYCPEPLPAD